MRSGSEFEIGPPLEPALLRRRADRVAREILGAYLIRRLEKIDLVVRVIETEAYLGAPDRASHAWNGRRTERNRSLYLPGGHTYVYFVYGMHHCFNIVSGEGDHGEAVLIRAAEAIDGLEVMRRRRARPEPLGPGDLLGGPAKLCQALGIDRGLDGLALPNARISLCRGPGYADADVVCGPRVGVGYAVEAASWPLRFAVRNHSGVSRPLPSRGLGRYRLWRRSEPFAEVVRPSH